MSNGSTRAPAPLVVIDQLSYRYPNGYLALDDISFSIGQGEKVGLVGPSGAGKSTLLMHLNGLLPEKLPNQPQAEETVPVSICDMPVVKQQLDQVRRSVGFLFQDPDDQLFCPTVREDVAFGPLNLGLTSAEVNQRVAESLEEVDLPDFGERSTLQLSFGERKRICLAGIFACRPALLALDEPSSNLDPRARKNLLRILHGFEGGQIIATHDLDLIVDLCDRVIVLDEGTLHADGTPADVLSNAALMEQHGLEVPLRLLLRESK